MLDKYYIRHISQTSTKFNVQEKKDKKKEFLFIILRRSTICHT